MQYYFLVSSTKNGKFLIKKNDEFRPFHPTRRSSAPIGPKSQIEGEFFDEYVKVLPELYQQNFSNLFVNGVIITEKKMGLYVLTFCRRKYGTAAAVSFAATP